MANKTEKKRNSKRNKSKKNKSKKIKMHGGFWPFDKKPDEPKFDGVVASGDTDNKKEAIKTPSFFSGWFGPSKTTEEKIAEEKKKTEEKIIAEKKKKADELNPKKGVFDFLGGWFGSSKPMSIEPTSNVSAPLNTPQPQNKLNGGKHRKKQQNNQQNK